VGIESTIVDCTRGAPVLLRPGGISRLQIEAACGRPLLSGDEAETTELPAPKASGTLASHYAPRARVRLMDAKALQQALDLLGKDIDAAPSSGPSIAVYARARLRTVSSRILLRQMPGDAAVAAHELFSVLRELDDKNVKLIWVETPPDTTVWDGVRDRLERASA
jgi:L-threonylcarbamoyladenylate synthase